MRTWKVCLFALSAITAVYAQDSNSSSSAPTGLDVAHMSSSSIFLHWKWIEGDVSLAKAKFVVTATPEGREASSVTVEGKLYLVLDRLILGSDYEITVGFVNSNGTTDLSDSLEVRTHDEDFFKPTIVSNENGDRNGSNSISYNTSWVPMSSNAGELTGYEVLYCTSSCEVQLADKDAKSSRKDLDVYYEYTVVVAAVLKDEDKKLSKVASSSSTFWSNVGAPTAVRHLNFTGSGGNVNLQWETPETPRGPIDGYVVRITDKTKKENKEDEVGRTALSYSFKEVENCTEYDFAVLAFNNDLVSKQKINGSLSETVSYTSKNCGDAGKPGGFPVWATVLIVLAVLGAAGGGGAFYYMKRRRESLGPRHERLGESES